MIPQIVSTSYLLRSAHAFSSLTPHKQTLLLQQGFNVLMYAVQKQLADTRHTEYSYIYWRDTIKYDSILAAEIYLLSSF